MELKVTSGSLFNGLAIAGSGLMGLFPEQKLIGLAVVSLGIGLIVFDVHFENGHFAAGDASTFGRRLRRMWYQILVVIGVICFVAGAYGWWTHRATVQEKIAASPRKLAIECTEHDFLPKVYPASGALHTVQLSDDPNWFAGGPVTHNSAPGTPFEWATSPQGQDSVTCKITNYETEPFVSLNLKLHIEFNEVIRHPDRHAQISTGRVVIARDWDITIKKVEPGVSEPYVFYILNFSKLWARATLPKIAILKQENGANLYISLMNMPDTSATLSPAP